MRWRNPVRRHRQPIDLLVFHERRRIPVGSQLYPRRWMNESTTSSVAASCGGVSTVIATPSWQTGTGGPAARSGRYTSDVSFSASNHDGYFACMAAISGGGCVTSGGSFGFIIFSGTSAAAPGMAGVAALLDQKLGAAQGNLNPQLYPLAIFAPAAFHDTTVATSGVSGCSVSTPSICNNSIPSPSSQTVGQAGFLVGTGYDEVTGLGSLDVQVFLSNYGVSKTTPTVTVTPTPSSITTVQTLSVKIAVSGNPTATGSVKLTSGNYSSAATSLVGGGSTINAPAGSLAAGTDTFAATYTPDSSSCSIYNTASGSNTVTVTKVTPTVTVTPTPSSITTAQSVSVTIAVSGGAGSPTATGYVTHTSGTYSSGAAALAGGSATIIVPVGALAAGTDTLNASYTPDSSSSRIYNGASNTARETVTQAPAPFESLENAVDSVT